MFGFYCKTLYSLRICLAISNWGQTHDDRLMVNLLLMFNTINLHHS